MASEGPNSAGTGADDAGIGVVPWTNPGNITASDNAYATASVFSVTSHYLKATNFGFAIPSGATIDGIVVEWERKCASSLVTDVASRIVKGGTIGSTDKAAGGAWGTSDAYQSYGTGTTDLWGETWTDTDINASNFGAALAVTASGSDTASVDHCRITVHYTAAAASQMPGVQTILCRADVPTDPTFTE